ncbi:DNA starvation/stationary phase protection protein [Sulfodiicoccus acidiphilus]|uniref:DNA starvation/stationary phase protection protein n=1 Tax=Sulfodiicoccus acidiphilus TaxID=1670455 RepID=A0A348B2G3_9CREN|nr:DNA starvation/stationary phase protection protein [Sulfodiicoccus acidiphilus]BBD72365.1 DNA starvation/stationary phase protection protein [Sulfodiicoccus acidiphilus]GGT90016.1 DNA starvation/stationary phase protection protein [Sulfodiicoccus acidiphilus]
MSSELVVEYLRRAVANSMSIYMNYKRYHWNTYGPLFYETHLLFDQLAGDVLKTVDEFAERIRMLDSEALGSPEEIAKGATVKFASSGMSVKAMIEQAIENHRLVIGEFKKAIRQAEEDGDPGTADVFVRNIQVHEKAEWFLREHLKEGGGLIR